MVQETGLKLRTKLESAKTLRARTGEGETYSAGDIIKIGDTIGIVVEDVNENSDFILVYEAEKVLAKKKTGQGENFSIGDNVYYDATAKALTPISTGNTICGKALADADENDEEVLIDLIVLA